MGRRQFVVDILHPGSAGVSKDDLREKLAGLYKSEKAAVSVFGLKTHFGGGKTTGFGLIYDSAEALKKFEPKYRQIRYGVATKTEGPGRQQRRQKKNRGKKIFGTGKREAKRAARKAAE